MKKWISFLATLMILSAFADAAAKGHRPVWKCYRGGTDDGQLQVTKAETVAVEKIPNFFPTASWDHPWYGKKVTSEVVGKYRGLKVYCYTFKDTLSPNELEREFDYAMLACDITVGKGPRKVRVFFTSLGEFVREFRVRAIKTGRNFSRFEIREDIEGNGANWDTCLLDLRPSGPWLREATFGGRKLPTVTYHYDRAGRIVSTEKEEYGK